MIADVLVLVVLVGAFVGAMYYVRGRALEAQKEPSPYTDLPLPPSAASESGLVAAPLPPPADHGRALQASRDQAVLLRRDFPPRPGSLDRWGGVPLVPRGFTWPFFVADDGAERALHCLLQLDCASIPERGRLGLMPDHGMLYVFLDLDRHTHWKWSVRYETGDLADFVPAKVPASLPCAYSDRRAWVWPQRDEDWPRLLPEWSIDPVLLTGGRPRGVEDESSDGKLDFWPGTIPVPERLEEIEGAVVSSRFHHNAYDDTGALVRPYATFPHDWQAVRITMGHASRQADRQHLDNLVERGETTEAEAVDYLARLRQGVDSWSRLAQAEEPWTPLTSQERDAVWQFLLDHQAVVLFGLTEAVNESVEATLSGSPLAEEILPPEALDPVRIRHALGVRSDDGSVAFASSTARMLCAPSYVQGDAEERISEWLLLLELAESQPIGHLFGESVYQFWIRPGDLAARRFDLVQLTASAY
ncbi:DUF1963 domain-containing protein [Nocardioides agariphilus]|jgi:hypothetical protein|uniref:DUF1963 domain-containing protein n=1 Tax=Nocardioides agariphilus TaxID=433664 RepID=A0A930YPH5_9ACTN|nr:DUF1963 domain-containing protein [Nocardioides agariphilus]MBF4767715.1 DUF1963 domain-containing protein [Nocardioides agariphilus]